MPEHGIYEIGQAAALALSRNIPQADAALRDGRWERSRFAGIELAGKTLGLLGFGRIGQQVARRAFALEMRVVAFDPFVARERFRELGVERAESLESVLAEADFLTLHLALTDETRGIIGREAFAGMRDGVRIVNAARGELIDEEALIEALRSGKAAAAALDQIRRQLRCRADHDRVVPADDRGEVGVAVDVHVEAGAEELDARVGDPLSDQDPHTRAPSAYASSARVTATPRSTSAPASTRASSTAASAVVMSNTS